MRKPPTSEVNPVAIATVLSVSPAEEDHVFLSKVLKHPEWVLYSARELAAALGLLRGNLVAAVLCDQDGLPGTWEAALEQTAGGPHPPAVIVTSRLANDTLWAEALNLGAYDVLAKPFDAQEVIRVLGSAWQHWRSQFNPAPMGRTMRAGSAA